jgi:hypothetical protein
MKKVMNYFFATIYRGENLKMFGFENQFFETDAQDNHRC